MRYLLLGVWEESKTFSIDCEIKARIIGVETQMESFDFLLASLLLRQSIQHESLSAAEGQHIGKLTLDVLKSLHNDEQFMKKLYHLSESVRCKSTVAMQKVVWRLRQVKVIILLQ